MPGIGDRKPSMLLEEMRSLTCGHISCLLSEEIFIRQMPDDVRMQWAGADFTDLQKSGERADEIWPARPTDVIKQSVKRSKMNEHKKAQAKPETPENMCFYHKSFESRA
ncbi:hypothetical protein RF11_07998 [Thelohanellus kitauei]|uniref:Uncharacterized protein n=1 Tax=Thelohanellus kitauei TaxID=669202 RepID=A0A0C2JBD8_THEKT|nr:hypothetical protein RF11_07998 [Thelohanellus kitauei]